MQNFFYSFFPNRLGCGDFVASTAVSLRHKGVNFNPRLCLYYPNPVAVTAIIDFYSYSDFRFAYNSLIPTESQAASLGKRSKASNSKL